MTNTLNVGKVADALVAYILEHNPSIGVTTGTVNPVVCECNDGFLNDIGGRHIGEQEVRAALQSTTERTAAMAAADLAIAFSTAQSIPHDPAPLTHSITVLNEQNPVIDALFAAVVETTEEAVVNALFAAHSIEGRDGHYVESLTVDETIAILRRRGI